MAITIIATNNTAGIITLDDLGIELSSSESRNLSDTFDTDEIIHSNDLKNNVISGDIGINDGIDDLSIQNALYHLNIESEYQDLEQDESISGIVLEDTPAIKVINPSPVTFENTFTNIDWSVLKFSNNTDVLEWDISNPDRILIKEDGLYNIEFSLYLRISAGANFAYTYCRVVKNDIDVVSYETFLNTYVNEVQQLMNSGYVELQSGDYITLQGQGTAGTTNEALVSYLNIAKMQGVKGDDGAPGGTTVNIQENDTTIVSNVDTINFEGDSVNVIDEGSNKVTINVTDSSHIFKYINIYNSNGNINLNNSTSPSPYPFNTQTIRDVDTFDHSIITNNTRVNVLKNGWYKVSYQINYDNGLYRRNILTFIRINGVTTIEQSYSASYTRNSTNEHGTNSLPPLLIQLNAGDYIELMYRREGTTGSVTSKAGCWLQLEFCRED